MSFLMLVALVSIGVRAAGFAPHAWSLAGHLSDLRQAAAGWGQGGQGTVPYADVMEPALFARLGEALGGASSDLEALDPCLQPWLMAAGRLGWLPGCGAWLEATPHLYGMARALLRLGADVSEAVALTPGSLSHPMGEGVDDSPPSTRPHVASGVLRGGAGVSPKGPEVEALLRDAAAALAAARESRARIDAGSLPEPLSRRLVQFDRLAPLLQAVLDAGPALPALLGLDRPRTYLILAQNDDELRPTGGFITAAGHVRVNGGRIEAVEVRDSYAADDLTKTYPQPPDPLREYMGAEQWLVRDANWSVDFPTAAETAAGLYEMGTGLRVDGVVAFDQVALQYLLEAIGPVDVGGERVTADSAVDWARTQWAPGEGQKLDGEWWKGRKTFTAELTDAIRERFKDPKTIDAERAAEWGWRALVERHVLVYSREPGAARVLEEQGWDGHVDGRSADFAMVVEANVGFNKASPTIDRKMYYVVRLQADGGVVAEAVLTYTHRSAAREDPCDPGPRYDPLYVQMMDRCYWSYLRWVVPSGAERLAGPRDVVPGGSLTRGRDSSGAVDEEVVSSTRTSWGQLFLLRPGETHAVRYRYRLPAGTAREDSAQGVHVYELLVQKQPGLRGLQVSVSVTLPTGARSARLVEAAPAPESVDGGTLTFAFDLVTDQAVRVVYE